MSERYYLSLPTIEREKFPGKLTFVESQDSQGIQAFHQRNWAAANQIDFPGNKDEDWRWVDLEQFPDVFHPSETKPALHFGYIDEDNIQSSQVPAGVLLTDLRTAQKEQTQRWYELAGKTVNTKADKFAAMTAALAQNGVFLNVPKNVSVPGVVLIDVNHGSLAGSTFTHHILILEEGAQANLVLRITGAQTEQTGLVSDLVEIRLEAGAQLNLTEVQTLPRQVWQISHEKAVLENQASLTWTYITLGAGTTKNFVTVDLNGEGAHAIARGVYFASANQHFDLDTQQNHNAAHTTSDLLYKGAANANGKATWEGMIVVDRVAQQTDGYQSNRNLILSDLAEINTIPGLEINADDVKCSHGATVGRLNDDELFYLQCRGIPLAEAKTLIVQGFFAGILDGIPHEATKNELGKMITEKLREE